MGSALEVRTDREPWRAGLGVSMVGRGEGVLWRKAVIVMCCGDRRWTTMLVSMWVG